MTIEVINQVFLRTSKAAKAKADIWFIHGFGESGLSFKEAFQSKLASSFNLFIPDLPGFGASPPQEEFTSIQQSADCLEALIRKESTNKPLIIVAHSLGGIMGAWLCTRFKNQIQKFVNIEGNLTHADAFFSGLAKDFSEPNAFHSLLIEKVAGKLANDESMHRYYASIRFSNPNSLWQWGKTGADATGETTAGNEFKALKCKKIYYWGDKSTPEQTTSFIESHNLPNYCFKGSGHWPMIDSTDHFYETLHSFLIESQGG